MRSEKRFLFYIGHPAHYHNVKNLTLRLQALGHRVLWVARGKDVLFELLDADSPCEVVRLKPRARGSHAQLVASMLVREAQMLQIALRFRPDVLCGTDFIITHVGKFLGIPALILNEDDSSAVPLLVRYGYRFATGIIAPHCCDCSPYNHKQIGYTGYQELAYLHPSIFTPNRDLAQRYMGSDPYIILRFASLNAHHDEGITGISDELALRLIEEAKQQARIIITSERPLSDKLEPFRMPISPRDMHHVLAFARLYAGDSQTMTAESAVLGVPALRYNDFVGRLNYLEELEHKWELTRGIKPPDSEELIQTFKHWVHDETLHQKWQTKRKAMLLASDNVLEKWVKILLQFAR